jgi:putative ABC transport system ATP-binding protein
MISFESVSYENNGNQILSDISFKLAEGQTACLNGPSGSGKSTILKLVMGIYLPVSGSVMVSNQTVNRENLARIRRLIAYIDQDAVMGAETAERALLLPFEFKANHNVRPDRSAIDAVLQDVGLEPNILGQKTANISGGERQRLAIARALLLRKKIFITDEVTSALDPENRRKITRLLLNMNKTLLAVSHDEEFLDDYDQVVRLRAGRIV